MVSLRRFGPLLGVFVLALAVLVSRLWDVQVREHPIWAREAAGLVRSWFIEPYTRGEIRDRDGRLLVRDDEVYELDFVWRDFRRGHPLGQVAALRSLALGRPVGLAEAQGRLAQWAEELARLTPAEIDAFGRGESLAVGDLVVPAVGGTTWRERRRRARLERRPSRASDLHFYVKALLRPTDRTLRELARVRGTAAARRSYLELVAESERVVPMERLRRLRASVEHSLDHLQALATHLDRTRGAASSALGHRSAFGHLVERLEETRRRVEDDIADDLFRRAAGFDASRLSAANLAALDLGWLARALVWDEARLATWRTERGATFATAVEEHLAGYAIARAKLAAERFSAGDRVLSSLAYVFHGSAKRTLGASAVPVPWWDVDDVSVVTQLVEHLDHGRRLRDAAAEPLLPFQDPGLRARRFGTDEEQLAVALADVAFPEPAREGVAPRDAAVETLVRVARSRAPEWAAGQDEPIRHVLVDWHERLQARVGELLATLPAPVALAPEWIDLATKARAYVVRDRGARAVRVAQEPTYDLVRLVTRHPDRYAGFEVRSTTRRQPVAFVEAAAAADGLSPPRVPVARGLIGVVRAPTLVSLLEQRPHELALEELTSKRELPEADREVILEHVGATWQEGTSTGSSGIEAYFDRELRGRNGYRESTGLQDRREGNRAPIFEEPIDGLPLRTTLDLELQRAAQGVLDRPDPPPDDETRPDRVWHRFPVGALCLITVEGDVLVAASGPSVPGEPGPFRKDQQRRHSGERTLRQHTFQPPGSVLKPFVAAWALDRGWIGEEYAVDCESREDPFGTHREGATVHCHLEWGHKRVDLRRSLVDSCNAYYADVGERFYDGPAVRAMARAFGFDLPTGVRALEAQASRPVWALREDPRSYGFFTREPDVATPPMLQRLGNGLSHISVTPLQVARAYAGLATGRLPELRLVHSVGDTILPWRAEPVPLSRPSLEVVRRALREVPLAGTAEGKGLDPETLGFTLACKTGSADYGPGRVPVDPLAPLSFDPAAWEPGMRKHGWVAAWFPADRPVAVVVAYVHDTSTTSSHVATHLLSQFLRSEPVQAWARERRILQ